jgi:hypothetical protein
MFQKGARRFHATKRAGFETKVQVPTRSRVTLMPGGGVISRKTWRPDELRERDRGEDSAGQAFWLPV